MNRVMKNWMLYSVLGTAFTLTACVDNDKDFSVPTDPTTDKTVDLKVPADFTWNVTDRVNLEVNSPVSSVISVYTDAKCTDASLLATLPVKGGELIKIELDVPAACQAIYVKYPTGETTTAISKVDVKTVSATRAEGTKEVTVTSDNLRGVYEFQAGNDEHGLVQVATSGTVLFEDNWPNLGDYDFNDLVADYRIETHFSPGVEEQYQYEHINVTVGIRAIGGHYPAKLGLQFLGGLHQKHIERYEGLNVTTAEGLKVKLANPDKMDEAPIFYIDGLDKLKKEGEMCYNTEKQDAQTVATVSFSMYTSLKNNYNASSAYTQASRATNQDFFLVTTAGREIHLRGFEPTALYTTYQKDASETKEVTMGDKNYTTDKNLVWGMKVVSGFHFPLEKADIRKAYNPNFAKWVESDGKEAVNWYEQPIDELVANW